MSGKIFIESKPIFASFDHLYLVFQDDNGQEFVIRGGPERLNIQLDFGRLVVEAGVPIAISEDRRTKGWNELGFSIDPAQRRRREIDLAGREASDVWQIAIQQARAIDRAQLDYRLLMFGQNSNSTAASVLNAVGINWLENLPGNPVEDTFPGMLNLLPVPTTLMGTPANDVIWGGQANDILSGDAGDDLIKGGGGNDAIDGGAGTGDVAIFTDAVENYQISVLPEGQVTTIAHLGGLGSEGIDTLRNIEFAEFRDWRGTHRVSLQQRDDDLLSNSTQSDILVGHESSHLGRERTNLGRERTNLGRESTRLVAKLGWSPHAAGAPTLKNNNSTNLARRNTNDTTRNNPTINHFGQVSHLVHSFQIGAPPTNIPEIFAHF